jgi:hypothetical protein
MYPITESNMFQNEVMTLHSIARFFASQRVRGKDPARSIKEQIEDRSDDDTSILVHANTNNDVQFTPSPACGAHLVITPQLHLLLKNGYLFRVSIRIGYPVPLSETPIEQQQQSFTNAKPQLSNTLPYCTTA